MDEKRRFIGIAAHRNRREEWRIRLDEESAVRHDSSRFADILGRAKRHYARNGNVEPEVKKRTAKRGRAGEAVDYPLRRNFAQDSERIVVCVARMDDDWEAKHVREIELPREKLALGIARLGRIVVVEPYLPYCGNSCVVKRREFLPRLVAIPADCAILEALRTHIKRLAPADGHYARYASGLGALYGRGGFAARSLEVRVCIEKLQQFSAP